MLDPAIATGSVVVAGAIMMSGFILEIPVLVVLGIVLVPLAVLSGVPMWGRRGGGYRH